MILLIYSHLYETSRRSGRYTGVGDGDSDVLDRPRRPSRSWRRRQYPLIGAELVLGACVDKAVSELGVWTARLVIVSGRQAKEGHGSVGSTARHVDPEGERVKRRGVVVGICHCH